MHSKCWALFSALHKKKANKLSKQLLVEHTWPSFHSLTRCTEPRLHFIFGTKAEGNIRGTLLIMVQFPPTDMESKIFSTDWNHEEHFKKCFCLKRRQRAVTRQDCCKDLEVLGLCWETAHCFEVSLKTHKLIQHSQSALSLWRGLRMKFWRILNSYH